MIPTKEQANEIIRKYLQEYPNIEHCLLVGAGMKGIAGLLEKTEEESNKWYVIGVLHDIDVEKYNGDIYKHCVIAQDILEKEGIDKDIINIIKTHNEVLGLERKSDVEHALYSVDGLSGIIRAYALMRPDKNIQLIETKSILKKYKDKFFAAAVSRDQIKLCESKLNITLDKFIEAVINGIKDEKVCLNQKLD